MRKLLTIILFSLLAGLLSAREAKVAVVMSRTSYNVAESETGGAGKAWTAVANLAGLPYETLFVEDLKAEALDKYSLLILSQCIYLTDAEYALVDGAVRHFVNAGKGLVVDGPLGLYDQEEEFRANRPADQFLGMKYLYDVPVGGNRLRVADNDHFITGPYHADQALSNLLAETLPVVSVSGPSRVLVNVTDDIHTYPYMTVLKKGDGKVAVLDGLSPKACIGASFKNYDPKGFFPSKVYPVLTRTLQWCQWGDVDTPFPSLLISGGDMTAIIRLDGYVSRHAPYAARRLVTKPLVFQGKKLVVNFSTSARGRIFLTVRDESGRELRSAEIFGDKVDRVVGFEGGSLADFAGRPVVLEFEMSDADLYSFRFGD